MQDLTQAATIAYGNTLGTAAGAADDNFFGCTFTRAGAGSYAVLFNTEPPGLTTAKNVVIVAYPLAVDDATTGLVVTKTLSGTQCTGFTVTTTATADTAWGFIAFRPPQAV